VRKWGSNDKFECERESEEKREWGLKLAREKENKKWHWLGYEKKYEEKRFEFWIEKRNDILMFVNDMIIK